MNNPFSIDAKILKDLYRSYTEAMNMNMVLYSDNKEEESIPALISESQFKKFIEIAFWASLTHEEGRFHEFSLVMLPKDNPNLPFAFSSPIPFDENNLAKLAPALDPLQILLGSGLGKMPVFTSGVLLRSTIRACTASV